MNCPRCHRPLGVRAKRCIYCGQAVGAPEVPGSKVVIREPAPAPEVAAEEPDSAPPPEPEAPGPSLARRYLQIGIATLLALLLVIMFMPFWRCPQCRGFGESVRKGRPVMGSVPDKGARKVDCGLCSGDGKVSLCRMIIKR